MYSTLKTKLKVNNHKLVGWLFASLLIFSLTASLMQPKTVEAAISYKWYYSSVGVDIGEFDGNTLKTGFSGGQTSGSQGIYSTNPGDGRQIRVDYCNNDEGILIQKNGNTSNITIGKHTDSALNKAPSNKEIAGDYDLSKCGDTSPSNDSTGARIVNVRLTLKVDGLQDGEVVAVAPFSLVLEKRGTGSELTRIATTDKIEGLTIRAADGGTVSSRDIEIKNDAITAGRYIVCINELPRGGIGPNATCKDFEKRAGTPADVAMTITLPKEGTLTSLSTEGDQDDNSCESLGGLAWIICPVIKLLDNATNELDGAIQAQLRTPNPENLGNNDDDQSENNLKEAWGRIRNIALAILLPIMMVMVIGTALGFSFVDAYTVKRAMPRFLIAILFISISWYITAFLVNITNIVGQGVYGIMTQPFGVQDKSLADFLNPSDAALASWGGIIIAGLAAAAGVLSLGIIASVVFVAFVALLIAFLILTVRQLVIFALLLLAPLAILAWIFPGNDKLWKTWWGTFSKLLLMYPLIMILLASGRIFASIIEMERGTSTVNQILIIFAFILPYFFIASTFKFAGGIFGALTGAIQDRSRGLFDRQRKYRQDEREKKVDELKAGNRLRGGTDSNLRGRLNKALQTASLAPAGGLTLSRSKRSARMATARSLRDFDNASKFMQENAAFGAIKGDDDKMWAMMNASSEQEVRDELKKRAPNRFSDPLVLDQAVAEIMRAKREGGDQVTRIAATRAQAGTGTGFNYRTDGVNDDMLDSIIATSGNDRGLAGRMLAEMRGAAMQSGRVDLAGGGFAKQATVMDKRRAALAGSASYSRDDARLEVLQDVLQSNAGAAVAGKVEGVRQLAPVMKANADRAMATGDKKVVARELAKLAGKYDAAAAIAPQNAEALADGVLDQGVDVGTLSPEVRAMLAPAIAEVQPDGTYSSRTQITYQQAIEALRQNPDFQTMRREYQTASTAAAASAAAASTTGVPPPGGVIPGAPPPTTG